MVDLFDITSAITSRLPEIKPPAIAPTARERLVWTGVALVLYFMMYSTVCFGAKQDHGVGGMDFFNMITASKTGSLLTVGIGPIVFASLFLQLFNGAGLFSIDTKSKDGRKKFLEAQKVFAILLAFAQAALFVYGGRVPLISLAGVDPALLSFLVILQIAMGSIVIMYLDEILTKYGIGSAVSLFIAAGVSYAIISGLMGLIFGSNGLLVTVAEGGAEAIPASVLVLLPFVFTVLVFLACVYAEGIRVELPIAFSRVRGLVPKLPLKFFYVSNIPVIFANALLLSVQLFAVTTLAGASFIIPGTDMDLAKLIAYVPSAEQPMIVDGLLYLITPIYYGGRDSMTHFNYIINGVSPVYRIPEWVHAIVYLLFLASFSVMFGLFWVEMGNMDAKSVASQLAGSRLQIPGFRADPRMLEGILQKYINPLTIVGSLSVGLLAGLADLTGALGTGTGILLTVGILYKMYEQMEQLRMFDLYPMLGRIARG